MRKIQLNFKKKLSTYDDTFATLKQMSNSLFLGLGKPRFLTDTITRYVSVDMSLIGVEKFNK